MLVDDGETVLCGEKSGSYWIGLRRVGEKYRIDADTVPV